MCWKRFYNFPFFAFKQWNYKVFRRNLLLIKHQLTVIYIRLQIDCVFSISNSENWILSAVFHLNDIAKENKNAFNNLIPLKIRPVNYLFYCVICTLPIYACFCISWAFCLRFLFNQWKWNALFVPLSRVF